MIEYCENFASDSDKCLKCVKGYIMTNDGLKCLPEALNCKDYELADTDVNSSKIHCKTCKNGFYSDSTTRSCLKGEIANCLKYTEKSKCSQCENEFYLQNETSCENHDKLENCKNYSPTVKDKCITCDYFTTLTTLANRCLESKEVENCKTYLDKTTC